MQPPDSTELLKGILETRLHRPVTYEEAATIGDSLLTFYEVLGRGAQEDE